MMVSYFITEYADLFNKEAAKNNFTYTEFEDGIVIKGSCTDSKVFDFVKKYIKGKKVATILTDPPYGNILLGESWDKTSMSQEQFSEWMFEWTKMWWPLLHNGGAFYLWGGIGVKKFRPLFLYLSQAEQRDDMDMTMVNYITWNKRRGYGTHRNYLFTREELAYFVKGKENLPRVFNIPLTSIERGYAGFNEKYPAKSKYLRRTNVWTIPELFRGKYHSCQKPLEVMQIPIETSSRKNDWILDMFAGSGATGFAARNAGRKFILIEQDPEHYNNIVQRMKIFKPGDKL